MTTKTSKIIKTSFLATLLLSLIVISTTGCAEGYRAAKGVVVDDQNGQPLDSVFCNVITGNDTQLTDETGKFDIHNRMTRCNNRRCPDITVEFSKNGYQTISFTNPQPNLTVRLTK
jgi:hypothetical protein